jgi:hypothetical protein
VGGSISHDYAYAALLSPLCLVVVLFSEFGNLLLGLQRRCPHSPYGYWGIEFASVTELLLWLLVPPFLIAVWLRAPRRRRPDDPDAVEAAIGNDTLTTVVTTAAADGL